MLTYGEIYVTHKTQDIHEHILASLSSSHEIRKPRSKVPSQRSRVHDKVVGPPNKLQKTNYNKQLPRRHQSQRTAYHKQLLIIDDTTCDDVVSKNTNTPQRKQRSIKTSNTYMRQERQTKSNVQCSWWARRAPEGFVTTT